MSGYNNLGIYKTLSTWDNFTVVVFDFLWLGGAVLRLWVKTPSGFVKAHEFSYAGSSPDVFILSPNQPVRYDVYSSTGSGSMTYVCAQVATEGSLDESGFSRFVDTGSTVITTATNGTTYPVKAIRKQAALRDVGVMMEFIDIMVSTTQDQARWTIQINPTLSATLTYAALANSPIEQATGNGTITVTTPGEIIAGGFIQSGVNVSLAQLNLNYLMWLGSTLTNTMDEYVLCITPVGGTLGTFSGIGFRYF
jgi:hypothetical protein